MKLRNTPSALVLIDGTDIHHDLIGAALALQEIAVEAGIPAARGVGLNRFAHPAPATADADTYLLYTSGAAFDEADQRALADLVAGGKGLVAVHAASVLDPDRDRTTAALIGARFLSHDLDGRSEGRFDVAPRPGHPVTRHLEPFAIDDEYYETAPAGDPVEILAERPGSHGPVPVAHARTHGAGRVVYTALGHDPRAWGNPGFRQLIRQAVLWTAGVPDEEIASWTTRWPLGNGRTLGGPA